MEREVIQAEGLVKVVEMMEQEGQEGTAMATTATMEKAENKGMEVAWMAVKLEGKIELVMVTVTVRGETSVVVNSKIVPVVGLSNLALLPVKDLATLLAAVSGAIQATNLCAA